MKDNEKKKMAELVKMFPNAEVEFNKKQKMFIIKNRENILKIKGEKK